MGGLSDIGGGEGPAHTTTQRASSRYAKCAWKENKFLSSLAQRTRGESERERESLGVSGGYKRRGLAPTTERERERQVAARKPEGQVRKGNGDETRGERRSIVYSE